MAGKELDFTSPAFNALKALYEKDLQPPVPNVHVFNNINEYAVSLKTGKVIAKKENPQESDLAQRLKNIANNKAQSRSRNRDPSRLAHLMKVKSKTDGIEEKVAMLEKTKKKTRQKNVLEKMEDSYKEGPLSILYNCIDKKKQLKVWTRRLRGLRGVCVGYLVAFDKHMNLAMMDVDEMFAVEEEIEYDPKEEQRVRKKKEKKKIWRRNKRKQLKLDKVKKENENTVELLVCNSDLVDKTLEICDKDQGFGFNLNLTTLGSICDEENKNISKTDQKTNSNKPSNSVNLGKLFCERNEGTCSIKETSCLSDKPVSDENTNSARSTILEICSNDTAETQNPDVCDIENLCEKLTRKERSSDSEGTSSDIEGKDSSVCSSDDGRLQICEDIQSENDNELGVVNALPAENIKQRLAYSKTRSLLKEEQLLKKEDVDFENETNYEIDILAKEIEEWTETYKSENLLQDNLKCKNNVTILDTENGKKDPDNIIKIDNTYEAQNEKTLKSDIEKYDIEMITEEIINLEEQQAVDTLDEMESLLKIENFGGTNDEVEFEKKQSSIGICEEMLMDTQEKTEVGSTITAQEETFGKFESYSGRKMLDEVNAPVKSEDKIVQNLKETEVEIINILGGSVSNVQPNNGIGAEQIKKEGTIFVNEQTISTFCEGKTICEEKDCKIITSDYNFEKKKKGKVLGTNEGVLTFIGDIEEDVEVTRIVNEKEDSSLKSEENEKQESLFIKPRPLITFVKEKENFSEEGKVEFHKVVENIHQDEKVKEKKELCSTENELVSCFMERERPITSNEEKKIMHLVTVGNTEHKKKELSSKEDKIIVSSIDQKMQIIPEKMVTECFSTVENFKHREDVDNPLTEEVTVDSFDEEPKKGAKDNVKVKCLGDKEERELLSTEETAGTFVKEAKQEVEDKEKKVAMLFTEEDTVDSFVREATQGTKSKEKKVESREDREEGEILSSEEGTSEKEITKGSNNKKVEEYLEDMEKRELLSSEKRNVTIVEKNRSTTEWLGGDKAEKEEGELSSTDDEASGSFSTRSKNIPKQETNKDLSKRLKKLDEKSSMKEKEKLTMRKKRFGGLVKSGERTSGKETEGRETYPKDGTRKVTKKVSKTLGADKEMVEKKERDKCDREKEVKNKTMKEKETRTSAKDKSIDKSSRDQTKTKSDRAQKSNVSSESTENISKIATPKQRTRNSVRSSVKGTGALKETGGHIRNVEKDRQEKRSVAGIKNRRVGGGQQLSDKVGKTEQRRNEQKKERKSDKEKETRKVNKDNTMVMERKTHNLEEENKGRRGEVNGKEKDILKNEHKKEDKIKQLVAKRPSTPKITNKCETTKRSENISTCLKDNNTKGGIKESEREDKRENITETKKGDLTSNNSKSSPSIVKHKHSSLKLKHVSEEMDLLKKTSSTKKVKTKSIVSNCKNVQEKEKRKSTSLAKVKKCGRTKPTASIDLSLKEDKHIKNEGRKDSLSQKERPGIDNKGSGEMRDKSVNDCQSKSLEESKKKIRLSTFGGPSTPVAVNFDKREEKKEKVKKEVNIKENKISKDKIKEDNGTKKTDTKTRVRGTGNERKHVDRNRKLKEEKKQTEMGVKNRMTMKTELSTKVSGKRSRDTDQPTRASKIRKIISNSEKRTLETKEAKLPGNVVTVRILKADRGKALVLKQRHVNQLFLRGDNIIMVAYQNDCVKK